MNKNKKYIKDRELVIVLTVIGTILLICGTYFVQKRFRDNNNLSTTNNGQTTEAKINLDPPTQEDIYRAESNKDRLTDQQATPSPTSGDTVGLKTVKPIITYAGQYAGDIQVGAYVSGVLDRAGTCRTDLTQDNFKLTNLVNAITDASSMSCPEMAFQVSDLPRKGDWTVTVTYTSVTGTGVSDAKQIKVN